MYQDYLKKILVGNDKEAIKYLRNDAIFFLF